jgi:hypothetical protein
MFALAVVMNALRMRPWWRSNPKIIPTNHFIWEQFRNRNRYKSKKYRRVMLNHIQHNHSLVTKNGLYLSLKAYCPTVDIDLATIVPHTFYLSAVPGDGDRSTELEEFISFNGDATDLIWILKPAFAANQGCGIKVISGLQECLTTIGCQQSQQKLQQEPADESEEASHSKKQAAPRITEWIVQRYMTQPLLVHGRKFDIRCYVLIVIKQSSSSKVLLHGVKDGCDLKAYLYKEGYIRTSGKKYNLNNLGDRETHLTNDAVQKKAASYGKYESGNKLTYDQFQDVICKDYPAAPPDVVRAKILPQLEYQVTPSCILKL